MCEWLKIWLWKALRTHKILTCQEAAWQSRPIDYPLSYAPRESLDLLPTSTPPCKCLDSSGCAIVLDTAFQCDQEGWKQSRTTFWLRTVWRAPWPSCPPRLSMGPWQVLVSIPFASDVSTALRFDSVDLATAISSSLHRALSLPFEEFRPVNKVKKLSRERLQQERYTGNIT